MHNTTQVQGVKVAYQSVVHLFPLYDNSQPKTQPTKIKMLLYFSLAKLSTALPQLQFRAVKQSYT